MKQPLNIYFINPVNPEKDGLVGYRDIVNHPMDFTTINENLKAGVYQSPRDWYDDVVLIYENALLYHGIKENTIWYTIAKFKLQEFKKMNKGYSCSDVQEWFDSVSEKMNQISEDISQSPVPQGMDPIIPTIIKQSGSLLPPKPQTIAELVFNLNKFLDNPRVHNDVLYILKQTQPDLKIEGEKFSINADELSDATLNALTMYIDSTVTRL